MPFSVSRIVTSVVPDLYKPMGMVIMLYSITKLFIALGDFSKFFLIAVSKLGPAEDERSDSGLIHYHALDPVRGDRAVDHSVVSERLELLGRLSGEEFLPALSASKVGQIPTGRRRNDGGSGGELSKGHHGLFALILISTYYDNGGFPYIAVPVRYAGENNDLAFLGCFCQNSSHKAQPLRVCVPQGIVQDKRGSTVLCHY